MENKQMLLKYLAKKTLNALKKSYTTFWLSPKGDFRLFERFFVKIRLKQFIAEKGKAEYNKYRELVTTYSDFDSYNWEFTYPQSILEDKFVILYGDKHTGKTTILTELFECLVNNINYDKSTGSYPLYMPCLDLYNKLESHPNITDAVCQILGISQELTEFLFKNYSVCFMLDDLNTLKFEQMETLLNALSKIDLTRHKVIFTSSNQAHKYVVPAMGNYVCRRYWINDFWDDFQYCRERGLLPNCWLMEKFLKSFDKLLDFRQKEFMCNPAKASLVYAYFALKDNIFYDFGEMQRLVFLNLTTNLQGLLNLDYGCFEKQLGAILFEHNKQAYCDKFDFSKQEMEDALAIYNFNDKQGAFVDNFIEKQVENYAHNKLIAAYFIAYFIADRVRLGIFDEVDYISGDRQQYWSDILQQTIILADLFAQWDNFEDLLNRLQDRLMPDYDSIAEAISVIDRYGTEAQQNVVTTMLVRGVLCIENPIASYRGEFICPTKKIEGEVYSGYCANPYDELFYYVTKYDFFEALKYIDIRLDKVAKYLIYELTRLVEDVGYDMQNLIKINDPLTQDILRYAASPYRHPFDRRAFETKGYVKLTFDCPADFKALKEITFNYYDRNYEVLRCLKNCAHVTTIAFGKEFHGTISGASFGLENLRYLTVEFENPKYHRFENTIITNDTQSVVLACVTSNPARGVTAYESTAYAGCQNIKKIVFPSTVKKIHPCAFANCTNLEELVLNDGLLSIGENAFFGCRNLKELDLPKSVFYLSKNPFGKCESLECIKVASGNDTFESINNCLFNTHDECLVVGCKNSIIPDKVKYIGQEAFLGVTFDSIELPDSLKEIREGAFNACINIKSIVIPEQVIVLGDWAFAFCYSLQSVDLSKNIKEIGESAFLSCNSLTEVKVSEKLCRVSNYAFKFCKKLKHFEFPKVVLDELGISAFESCTSLEEVTLPSNFIKIGFSVFAHCTNLTDVYFSKDCDKLGLSMFSGCTSLKRIVIPPLVEVIPNSVFYGCENLEHISCSGDNQKLLYKNNCIIDQENMNLIVGTNKSTIPEGVKSIGKYAFHARKNLKEIYIPQSVELIYSCAFQECTALKKIEIPSSVYSIMDQAFEECTNLQSIVLNNGLKKIERKAFFNCTALEQLDIPNTVISIEAAAFSKCRSIKRLKLSAALKELEEDVFEFCDSIESVQTFPALQRIGSYCFRGAKALKDIDLSNVKIMESYAFKDCISLKKVRLCENNTKVVNGTFSGCCGLQEIYIPRNIQYIDQAFQGCVNLINVVYGGTVGEWIAKTIDNPTLNFTLYDTPAQIVECTDGAWLIR